MSRDELSRLMGDTLSNPDMIREAMAIKDRPALESYIQDRGYDLSREELDEIWELASKVLNGSGEPASAARWRLDTLSR
ncbi:hypothetical protein [Desulfovibrio sp. Fe33]|uniref:hypothetical protein n=1 Tax=Desulfovibrio sp. Fe33 TaxID=3020842 RepID=UPI00234CD41D|nr:hypothetical protein [Desulfovibrio sp. Fe33]